MEYWARRPLHINLIGLLLTGSVWGILYLLGTLLGAQEYGSSLTDRAIICGELLAAILLVTRYYDRLPAAWSGLGIHLWWPRETVFGLLLGFGTALLASAPAMIMGGVRAETIASTELLYWGASISIGALFEELLFRGYLYQRLAEIVGTVSATLLVSAAFAAAHLGNPAISGPGLANILLAGIFFSLCYIRTGSLWLPVAAHAAWNLTLALIVGLPVSGIDFGVGLLKTEEGGPDLLTGGAFGPEGGMAGTLALIAGIAVVALTSVATYSPYTYASVFRAFHRLRRSIDSPSGSS